MTTLATAAPAPWSWVAAVALGMGCLVAFYLAAGWKR